MKNYKFDSLKEMIASMSAAIEEIKAYTDVPIDQQTAPNPVNQIPPSQDRLDTMNKQLTACMGAIRSMASYIEWHGNRLDSHSNKINENHQNIHARMDKHEDGHLPKIVGAEKMNAALKALGMDGDFEAKKQTVYAAKSVSAKIG